MAKKETLVCRPCGNMVMVSEIGSAMIECYECGTEMLPKAKSAAAKKPAAKKSTAKKKPAAKKAAPRKRK